MRELDEEKIGQLLKAWRKKARIGLEPMGEKIGKSGSTVGKIERGVSITVDNLNRMLPILKKTRRDLLAGLDGAADATSEPRTRPDQPEGSVPIAEHVAALRALRKEIEALGGGTGAQLTQSDYWKLGKDARGEDDKATPPVRPEPGSGRSKGRGRGRSGGRR